MSMPRGWPRAILFETDTRWGKNGLSKIRLATGLAGQSQPMAEVSCCHGLPRLRPWWPVPAFLAIGGPGKHDCRILRLHPEVPVRWALPYKGKKKRLARSALSALVQMAPGDTTVGSTPSSEVSSFHLTRSTELGLTHRTDTEKTRWEPDHFAHPQSL
jgi:hypothetical protein